ncbi:MAG: SapC family protein [Rickettsiales bacterium]|jgi:hypothetical protein
MSNETKNSKPEEQSSGLPLLYQQPIALDALRHATASIRSSTDFSFAKEANSLPLNAIEFIEAAKTYPIVFTNNPVPSPVVIVGLEQHNYFVRPDNSWQENIYIPAYLRQYPFIFYERSEESKFYLCVDEAAPHFSASKDDGASANQLYDSSGTPTEFTNNAMKFCTAFYHHHLITRNFCDDLQKYKLLQPYQSEITLASGKKTQLSGFQMIDETALNNLSNKNFLDLRDKGWIPFIYFALASTSNWKSLVDLEAKNSK